MSDQVAQQEQSKEFLVNNSGTLPLYIIQNNGKIPHDILKDKGMAFILQGPNLWQLKNTDVHSVIAPVEKGLEFLGKVYGGVHYNPKNIYLVKQHWDDYQFPVDQFRYVMRYFQAIYDKFKTEAAVILMLNQQTKEWRTLFVLQAGAREGSVIYAQPAITADNIPNPRDKAIIEAVLEDAVAAAYQKDIYDRYNTWYSEGFRIFGTIHSHCDFGAFHSGTDDADELHFDGLHITIGNVRSGWSYSARYMASKGAFKIDIERILGVENMKEVEEGVNEIEVEDEHLNLMMPNLLPTNLPFAVPGTGQTQPKNNTNYYGGYRGNPYSWRNDNLFEDDGPNNFRWKQYQYEQNVWNEKNVYRVYDWKHDRVLLIQAQYWHDNKAEFKHHEVIPDGDVPPKLLTKHAEWSAQQKKGITGSETEVAEEEMNLEEIEENFLDELPNGEILELPDHPVITLVNVPALNKLSVQPGEQMMKPSKLTKIKQRNKKATRITK
jgi:hypothetical protein